MSSPGMSGMSGMSDMSGVRLVGDIGGTNARFALLNEWGKPVKATTLRTDDFPGLYPTVSAFLKDNNVKQIDAAAIAVACPVNGDRIELTNNHWSFSIAETAQQLQLSAGRLHIANDFEALALAVPHLTDDELIKIGPGSSKASHTVAVIGPGTGLGVSGLVPCGDSWIPLRGEGGHVSLGVRTSREIAVYDIMRRQFRHVSAERFLSGDGLQNIQQALRQIDGLDARELSAAEITDRGIHDGDAVCSETLQIFCDLLGSCAGNLALTLGAKGGVYIGGGIVPKIADFFAQSGFRQQFEAKGRFQAYLQAIPTYVITAPYPALTGVAQLLS